MRYCAQCDEPITAANDSAEHIILNALGGRMKVKGVYCRKCNSTAGKSRDKGGICNTWDSALAKQLNPLCLLFDIKRDRGVPPSQTFPTASGETRRLHADGTSSPGRLSYEETPGEDGGTKVSVTARTVEEARHMLARIKSKFPHADTTEAATQIAIQTNYDSTPIRMDLLIGGQLAGRSIVKSALALAVRAGVNPASCNRARSYLRGNDGDPCFGYCHEPPIVVNRPANVVSHCVAISGSARSGLLLGYVEYFSVFRIVVLLSDQYAGPDVSDAYAVNPLNGEKLALQYDLSLSLADLEAVFRYERVTEGAVERAFAQVMPIAMARSFDREQNRVADDAVKYALANSGIPPSGQILPEHAPLLSRLIVERLMPFLIFHGPGRARGRPQPFTSAA